MEAKAVIFDYDGTLVDSRQLVVQSLRQMTLVYPGPAPCPDLLASLAKRSLRGQMEALLGPRVEEGFTDFNRHYQALMGQYLRPFPGIEGLLRALKKKGYKLAIVSNNERKGVLGGLDQLGWRPLFSPVLCREDLVRIKPDPEGLVRVLDRLYLRPEQALYIGDGSYDMEAARRAGIPGLLAIWKERDGGRKRPRPPADHVLRAPQDLRAILERLID